MKNVKGIVIANIAILLIVAGTVCVKRIYTSNFSELEANNNLLTESFNGLAEYNLFSNRIESYYEGRVFKDDVKLIYQQDTLLLSKVLSNKKTIIFYLSSEECAPCSEKITDDVLKLLDTIAPSASVKIITDFPSTRDYFIFQQSNPKLLQEVYNTINDDSFSFPASAAILFDQSNRISGLYIIDANFIDIFNESVPGLLDYISEN